MVKIIVTPSQLEAINSNAAHILIKGMPGSGKTVVLIEKVKQILADQPAAKILFIAYNRTLISYIKNQLKDISYKKDQLTIVNYHKWAKDLLIDTSYPIKLDFEYEQTIFRQLYDTYQSNSQYIRNKDYFEFVKDEFLWCRGKGLTELYDYLEVDRIGRGVALNKAFRTELFDFFETVRITLIKKDLITFSDLAILVANRAKEIRKIIKYSHVFVDEAQDLSQMQMKSLSRICGDDGQLVIAADLGQKIYKTDYTWKSAEINVQGGRTKTLEISHRSTKQIMAFATDLLRNDPLVNQREEIPTPNTTREGLKPLIVEVKKSQISSTAKIIKSILVADTDARIAVLCYGKTSCGSMVEGLKKLKINAPKIDNKNLDVASPGVKVITMHGAKGLEFDYVIIAGMSENFPNFKNIIADEKQERIDLSRRLLYVSLTRARKEVYILYKETPSLLLNEVSPDLYDKTFM